MKKLKKCFKNIKPQTLLKRLVDAGYERVEVCEAKGQVCLRGGYLDVFPITAENPVRIEFFDDEIDTMRTNRVERSDADPRQR